MFDLALRLQNRPGELARLGEAMGAAGASIEGGGVFSAGEFSIAHFLFADDVAARSAAEKSGLEVVAVRPVLVRRLKQDQPGQLGAIARALANAGVNIETQYSDHSNRLILVVDDVAAAERATKEWAA